MIQKPLDFQKMECSITVMTIGLDVFKLHGNCMTIWGIVEHKDFLIKPNGFNIPYDAEKSMGFQLNLQLRRISFERCP